jgi:hypothetical protein
MTKYCSKCGSTKDKALFYKNKTREDGLQDQCKDCNKAAVAYQKSNTAKMAVSTAKRRALKLNQMPLWFESEREAIAKLYAKAIEISKGGIRYHVDHIVPLNSKLVSGFHCLANLQILPAIENISKGNRFWEDMWI